jgi:hypothetical protein
MRINKTQYIGLGLIAICVFLYIVTFSFQSNNFSFGSSDYGPTFFPRVLAILIGILALILTLSDRKKMASDTTISDKAEEEILSDGQTLEDKKNAGKLVLYILGITFLYLLIMRPIGFVISTIAYIFLSIWLLRPKQHLHFLWILAGSVAFTLGLQYLFGTVMNVMLPPGLLK